MSHERLQLDIDQLSPIIEPNLLVALVDHAGKPASIDEAELRLTKH